MTPRTLRNGIERLRWMPAREVYTSGNSYLGLVRQAGSSFRERTLVARALLWRGHVVEGQNYTKTFRRRKAA